MCSCDRAPTPFVDMQCVIVQYLTPDSLSMSYKRLCKSLNMVVAAICSKRMYFNHFNSFVIFNN